MLHYLLGKDHPYTKITKSLRMAGMKNTITISEQYAETKFYHLRNLGTAVRWIIEYFRSLFPHSLPGTWGEFIL